MGARTHSITDKKSNKKTNMDIYENIKNGKYKNKVSLPSYPGQDPILKMTIQELSLPEIIEAKKKQSQYEDAIKAYSVALAEYQEEEGRMNKLFFDDCAEEEGLQNHPKRSAVEGKAWEHGHASGYGDIWYWYREFSELVK
jgi:hypothetical protein